MARANHTIQNFCVAFSNKGKTLVSHFREIEEIKVLRDPIMRMKVLKLNVISFFLPKTTGFKLL